MKNELRNNKGITLIALVITIIVLLILSGVSISMISSQDGILNKATGAKEAQKKATDEESVKLAVQAAMMNENGTVDIDTLNDELGLTGDKKIESLPAKIEINGTKYKIEKNGTVEDSTLKVGSEVEYQGEYFYVIGFLEDNNKLKLLAKYNLNAEGTAQDTTGAVNSCSFSSKTYWTSETNYPLDLNNYEIPEDVVTSAIKIARNYGKGLGVDTGRLMTINEVEALGGSWKDNSIDNCYDFVKSNDYWLGIVPGDTIGNVQVAMVVRTTNAGKENCLWQDYPFSGYSRPGVRPVIEVLKTEVE